MNHACLSNSDGSKTEKKYVDSSKHQNLRALDSWRVHNAYAYGK